MGVVFKYKFIDVGRNKATWTADTENPTYAWLCKEVRKHGVRSKCLDFYYIDDEFIEGVIEAGFRQIGKFEKLKVEETV